MRADRAGGIFAPVRNCVDGNDDVRFDLHQRAFKILR